MVLRALWYAPSGGLGHAAWAVAVLRSLRPRFLDAELLLALVTLCIQGAVLRGSSVVRLPSVRMANASPRCARRVSWRNRCSRTRWDVMRRWPAALALVEAEGGLTIGSYLPFRRMTLR